MRQLILDLLPASPPTLDNFVAGGNGETVAALTGWLAGIPGDTSFCLWGEAGSGCSHLLLASGFAYADAALDPTLASAPESEQLAVDHVDRLDDTGQVALFNRFNRLKMGCGQLLTAAGQPPAHLELREDLRTRIGQTLIYEIQSLSDEEKSAALRRHAIERGMLMDPGVVQYLLRHGRRDLPSLMAMLGSLDRASLEQKRPPTLPLLRELMQTSFDLENE